MPPRHPRLKSAPSHYNKNRAQSSSSTKTTNSRSVHISVPSADAAAPRKQTTFVSVEEATAAGPAPTSSREAERGEENGGSSDVYYTQEEDARHTQKRRKTKIRIRRVDRLRNWKKVRDIFMDELLRAEGPAGQTFPSTCAACQSAPGDLRCLDCMGTRMLCSKCMCHEHLREPLHRIRRWTGKSFERTSLHDNGLLLQLGHDGEPCSHPHPAATITIVDLINIHSVRVSFCECGHTPYYIQMLRASWWPASLKRPRSGFTLRTLQFFQALSLLSKTNGYDFWRTIVHMTDGTGISNIPHRYEEFMLAICCFRTLRMAKRGGRGHVPEGIGGTKEGELANECPACPHEEKNLDEGWKDVSPDDKWLYTQFIAVDANFKLKRKANGSQDVPLASGYAYFVAGDKYKLLLSDPKHQREVELKGCETNFAAGHDKVDTPSSDRFGTNGAGAAVCGRHDLFLPNGVGDLEKGERYVNMGYILLSAIKTACKEWWRYVISYDIACQFCVHFAERMKDFPVDFQINILACMIIFLIPKFHLPAHGSKCHIRYAFNFKTGVGRTYGEGIEGNWSEMNFASLMTREMAEEGRHETLDDLMGSLNWMKVKNMETRFAKSLEDAVESEEITRKRFDEVKATFDEGVVLRWDEMVAEWENDPDSFNPYVDQEEREISVKECLQQLGQEEAQEAASGVLHPHEVTASKFLATGLELEEQQRTLQKMRGKTPDEKLKVQTLRNTLMHRIKKWRTIQILYMPIVTTLLAEEDEGVESSLPESVKLWLPSQVPRERWATGIATGLANKEERLRIADADAALHQVRRYIRMRMGLVHYKEVHVAGRGNSTNTRAQDAINTIWLKVKRAADRYIQSHSALQSLCPDGGPWSRRLRPLDPKTDLKNAAGVDLEDDDLTDQRPAARRARMLGDGHRLVPWIWTVLECNGADVVGDDATEAEVVEGMRSVYCKARARVLRWQEEIKLLLEEMRRVIVYFVWKRNWWLGRRGLRPQAKADIQAGANAYAERQALVYEGLARKFVARWRGVAAKQGLSQRWPKSIDSAIASLAPPSPPTAPHGPRTSPSASIQPESVSGRVTPAGQIGATTPSSAATSSKSSTATLTTTPSTSASAPNLNVPTPPSNDAGTLEDIGGARYDQVVDLESGLDGIEEENDSEISDEDSDDEVAGYYGPDGYVSD